MLFTGPGEKITAITPVVPSTVSSPKASLFRIPVTGEFLKVLDTAYHSRSPAPSRRSGKPSDFQGSLPMRVVFVEHGVSVWPSLLISGQGRVPGRDECVAAYPINASLARVIASAVFRSASIEALFDEAMLKIAVAVPRKIRMARIRTVCPCCRLEDLLKAKIDFMICMRRPGSFLRRSLLRLSREFFAGQSFSYGF